MQSAQVALPMELWRQVQEFRRQRGRRLGIAAIDERIALVRLLECGLAGYQDANEPLGRGPEVDPQARPARPARDTNPTRDVDLPAPHFASPLMTPHSMGSWRVASQTS